MQHTLERPTLKPAPNDMAQRIRDALAKAGLNVSELAVRAGVKRTFLYDILNGKSCNPSPFKLSLVADALAVELSYLLGSDAPERDNADMVHIAPLERGGATPMVFSRGWLKQTLGAHAEDLRLWMVQGQEHAPLLRHQDVALIDTRASSARLPGSFLLREHGRFQVRSQAALYPATAELIGRIAWVSRLS